MALGTKSEKRAQRRSLRLSGAFMEATFSQQKQPGTDTGQVSK